MQRGRWTVSEPLHPDLREIGRTRFVRAQPGGLEAHVHPGAWEIVLVLGGTVEWWAGSERWTVEPGRYFLTRPDEPHGGSMSAMNPCELRWMQVADARAAPWLAEAACSGLASATLGRAFDALLEEHIRPRVDSESVVDAWITIALASLRDTSADPRAGSEVAGVVAAARADLGGSWPLARMAAVAGYSVPRFCALFRAAQGQSPGRWLRHARVAAARGMLAEGRSVGETALALGFATPQHFAAVFRAEAGVAPSTLRSGEDSRRIKGEWG